MTRYLEVTDKIHHVVDTMGTPNSAHCVRVFRGSSPLSRYAAKQRILYIETPYFAHQIFCIRRDDRIRLFLSAFCSMTE